ncbi:MAG: YgeY family selenium metabolism-linked hydrolase [Haliscomenobacter sp.]|nr:YgeY family selenium metabolism-linked hydrolase [Haliscomenobacter sp.]MBP9873500.1 YgeY family selenium metabolism-linked hydrolase [Haliscomenobacter sp.]
MPTPVLSNSEITGLVEFAQHLVRIPSYSGQEEKAIRLAEQQMKALGYDEVVVDSMGNLLGRIGNGPISVLFDAHLDTVEVNDPQDWTFPPFGGAIENGWLQGRGSVDMKSAAAAAVFAGAAARNLGWDKGKTIYVTCTVFEEDCDGENLKHLFRERHLRPDFVVICEPSNNVITLGHKGKAQIRIKTFGVSAHGSAPEKGVNAIYEMAEIIQRVERTNSNLPIIDGLKGTLVLSQISSISASLNAVPSECAIYLDRRTVPGETEADIRKEMDRLIAGKNAAWEIGTLNRKSWTGMDIRYEPFHAAWKIDPGHELTQACVAAFEEQFGQTPAAFDFWDFSTNAVTPVSLGIPTIGFGPGEYKLAHMRDERCAVQQIIDACGFYARLTARLASTASP